MTTPPTSLTIPPQVVFKSVELVCLHEAGHASAAIAVGADVLEMELYHDPDRPYGRTSVNKRRMENGPVIALGGFASELILFRANRLLDRQGNQPTMKAFLNEAFDNAAIDRVSFFGADHSTNGMWPQNLDQKFGEEADAFTRFLDLARVERIATALLNAGKLDQAQVAALK